MPRVDRRSDEDGVRIRPILPARVAECSARTKPDDACVGSAQDGWQCAAGNGWLASQSGPSEIWVAIDRNLEPVLKPVAQEHGHCAPRWFGIQNPSSISQPLIIAERIWEAVGLESRAKDRPRLVLPPLTTFLGVAVTSIRAACRLNIENVAVLAQCSPEMAVFPTDIDGQLIHFPGIVDWTLPTAQVATRRAAEFATPEADCLIGRAAAHSASKSSSSRKIRVNPSCRPLRKRLAVRYR